MFRLASVLLFFLAPLYALAQPATVVRDLQGFSPTTLSKSELESLLPGAKMSRLTSNGNEHIWTNGIDGNFVVSTTGRAQGGTPTTGRGKWSLTDDGRYCVLIEWKTSSDQWCRFVIKTTDGYYMAKSASLMTEKVYKFNVSR